MRLADIAAEVGITRPSLLYHVNSKEQLYTAVIERSFTALGHLFARRTEGGTFSSRLDELMSRYLSFLADNPHFAALLLRELLDGRGPGRTILLVQVAPILDAVEEFFAHAGPELRPGVSVRAAILQAGAAALVRAAAGPLRDPLWGVEDRTLELVRLLLLQEAARD